jgi:hypothetical protein
MGKLTKRLDLRFTDEEYEGIELHADGKSPREWARDRVLGALESANVSPAEVLAEVKAQSGLLGELVVEFMLHIHSGDGDKAYAKARELFERARKGGS